ncbi:hypothetical protein LNTAR_19212 [Lentisphaera araneosa HTCC2155]|uniref:Uncharacterized protein n=1 Tax=Lentisphaera araneosa HTCC2155 TaxID=313628 RepID=A6DQQ8_9BACT|nr:hypothetical protein [Lentisphaera araneosa]EDM25958.1 hypothetical protein LNTAR_19212 [Lentisphaera araneosa HTCC2155]
MDKESLELIHSSLSQEYTEDNKTVSIEIYSSGKDDWLLEIVDESGNSNVYDDEFKTDKLAFEQFIKDVKNEGIDAFIANG